VNIESHGNVSSCEVGGSGDENNIMDMSALKINDDDIILEEMETDRPLI